MQCALEARTEPFCWIREHGLRAFRATPAGVLRRRSKDTCSPLTAVSNGTTFGLYHGDGASPWGAEIAAISEDPCHRCYRPITPVSPFAVLSGRSRSSLRFSGSGSHRVTLGILK